ncbi:MAG TPA: hypothetical protein VGR09_15295 [Gemmatimonadales bacterium]|nr:hypothetical protein [Gemmatimonadales bacterium]
MSKPLALTAALLLLAGCNASNPTAPTTTAAPSFDQSTTGCPTALTHTAGTAGAAHVAVVCGD